jgi:hypothetical protein
MGVRFGVDDSNNLISAMRNNVTSATAIVDRLRVGSQHLVAQLDAGVLQGAAYTAGRGLFADLIIPSITKLGEAVDDVRAELASYEQAHSVVAEHGDLDYDDLTEAKKTAEEQLRLVEERLEQNTSFFTQVQSFFSGNLDELLAQNKKLENLRDRLEDEVDAYEDKIDKLEWFVSDVSRYFSDSAEALRLAVQAAIELSKIAVEPDGSYHAEGVNLALISGLIGAKIPTRTTPAAIPDGSPTFDNLEAAAKLGYDKLVEWLGSDDGRTLHNLARRNPGLLDSMLREAYRFKAEGDPLGALGALLNLMSENGWIALKGGQTMLDKFETGGEWDLKRYLADEYGYGSGAFHLYDDEGRITRSDVFGNINYGAMLAHWDVDLDMALKGANSGSRGGVNAGVNDELDDRAVAFGYELYKKYPNGLTQEQYYKEIADANLFE